MKAFTHLFAAIRDRLCSSQPRFNGDILRQSSKARLLLEGLETRIVLSGNELAFVIPLSQRSDANHVYTLADAMNIAEVFGTVIIEPGTTPDPGPVPVILDGITIRGDRNVPASILSQYALDVLAPQVTLTNLNLSSVRFGRAPGDAGVFSTTLSNSVVQDLTESGNTLTCTENTITGQALFQNDGLHGSDVIANNTFRNLTGTSLVIESSAGTVIRHNIFLPGSDADALSVDSSGTSSLPVTVADNSITASAGPGSVGILLSLGNDSTIHVLNNAINTNNVGVGLDVRVHGANPFTVLVQGNDFRSNRIGVRIEGDIGAGTVDLGGGPLGSLGGNDFRDYTQVIDSGWAAILWIQPGTGSIPARNNLFRAGVNPTSVVSSSVDVSQPLSNERAFVQALYNELLGRSGTLAELDLWVGLLPAQGQAAVAAAILHSSEALGRIVDALYLRFLGRESDPTGRAGWIGFLQRGGTEEQIEDLFLTSPEYISHINTDYVQSLYLNILGRPGTSDELAVWNNNIQHLGLAAIADAFVHSPEYRLNTLRLDFETFLHRLAGDNELMPLANTSLDLLALEQLVLSSPEFFVNGSARRLVPTGVAMSASVFVVPTGQPLDATHFDSLELAIEAAGPRGTVTIEPETSPIATVVMVTEDGIAIRGDPNVPASILTPYQLNLSADDVTLTNLNLSGIQIGDFSDLRSGIVVSNCLTNDVSANVINATFTQNTVNGGAFFGGNHTGSDRITNNTFLAQSVFDFALSISSRGGMVVSHNRFFVLDAGAAALGVFNSGLVSNPCVVSDNTIQIDHGLAINVFEDPSTESAVNILNNTIIVTNPAPNPRGTGLFLNGPNARFLVQGNAFHQAQVGIEVVGDGLHAGTIDLGGGPLGSLGGNDFREFTGVGTASSAAISVTMADETSVSAQHNLFTAGVAPHTVFWDPAGAIGPTQPLEPGRSFIESIYNLVLGHTGTLAEIDPWVQLAASQGLSAVANALLHSNEALGQVVDQLYLRFLGRASDPTGRAGWISFLQNGGTLEQVETFFLTSPEYISHINVDYVQSLYVNILSRLGSQAELAQWNNNIQNVGGLSGVANAFTHSSEHRLNTLRTDFQTFLHRTPTDSELTPLVSTSLDLLSLESAVLSSVEFFANG
jgi:hypothetical protein